MRLVYCAGAYRAPTAWEIGENVRLAKLAGRDVAALGAVPVIPQANTEHFDDIRDAEFWLAGTLELMRRCDAVYVFNTCDLVKSQGTIGEWREAERLGMPAFDRLVDLYMWLEKQK